MSHEIDQTTGRAAAMHAGEGTWHGLGTVIESAATSADAIKLAGLDWTVEQWPPWRSLRRQTFHRAGRRSAGACFFDLPTRS